MACSSADVEEGTGGAAASGGGDPGVTSSGSGTGGAATSGAGAGSAASASGAGGGGTATGASSTSSTGASSTSGAATSSSSTGASSTTGAGGSDPGAASPACAGLNNGSGTTIPCAATADGKAVCFASTTPTTLTYEGGGEVTGVVQATGRNFSEEACVLLDTGAVHCGRHTSISRTPTVAAGATMISGGLNHACAIVGSAVKCWGGDFPADVSFGGEAPVQVACYYHGCCAVTDAGKLSCWGENNGGMHGIGTSSGTGGPVSPTTVPGRALYVGPGQDHMCAVFEGGKVQCWGQDWNKQLGGLGASSDPGVTLVESGAVAVVGGQFHTCVLMATGQVQCSSGGQSEGAGLDMGRLAPVAGISTAVALAAGKHYSCARLADASVQCWGSISHGATPATINGLRTRDCD